MDEIIRNIEEIKKDLRKQLELLAEAVQKTDDENEEAAICEAFEEAARELVRWGSLADWLQR